MATYSSRRKLGTRRVAVHDVEHIRVHYDDHLYLYAPNRGGLWNFGDGELAVAYLAGPVDYQAPLPPGKPGPYRHSHPIAERGARAGGALLSRSFDYGRTWPDNERSWIWHNDRSDNEILDWLRPRAPEQREQIDLTQPDSIIHFCHGEYLRFPFGGRELRNDPRLPPGINFHLGRREHPPSFSLRSRGPRPHLGAPRHADRGAVVGARGRIPLCEPRPRSVRQRRARHGGRHLSAQCRLLLCQLRSRPLVAVRQRDCSRGPYVPICSTATAISGYTDCPTTGCCASCTASPKTGPTWPSPRTTA